MIETSNKGERLRHSPYPMILVDDALKIVFEHATKMTIIDKPVTGKYHLYIISIF